MTPEFEFHQRNRDLHPPVYTPIYKTSVLRSPRIPLATRMYFGDEDAANAKDPVLNIIEQRERRRPLIAPRSERDGAVVYTFDIYLQGDRETVFFDV
jgi:protocatechuate 3,4-dioxygenase alpha subunit